MRILIYDQRCKGPGATRWLARSFRVGAQVFGGTRFFDAVIPSSSWAQALGDALRAAAHAPVDEIQFWGHGKWGRALLGSESLDRAALTKSGAVSESLAALGGHMNPTSSTLWFRTCETFGAQPGHDFARHLAAHMGARVAGHTYIIGPLQSGLHLLAPGQRPAWSDSEGLAEGTPQAPLRARWSSISAPNTITCLRRSLPAHI